jgi:PAS domain S-box-containing protein
MKNIFAKIGKLILVKSIAISFIFGIMSVLTGYWGFRIYLPGSVTTTDPREIFNAIGAAITGPVGGLIISIISSARVSHPEFRIYIFITHLISALWMGIAYKKLIIRKYGIFAFSICWLGLISIYYFIQLDVMGIFYYYFNPTVYIKVTGGYFPLIKSMAKNLFDYYPEIIFTTFITTLILIALPAKYRKTCWGAQIEYSGFTMKDRTLKLPFIKFFNKYFLSIRLTIWFLILFTIPLLYLSISVRNYFSDFVLNSEGRQQFESAKNVSIILNNVSDNSLLSALKEIQSKGEFNIILLDKNLKILSGFNNTISKSIDTGEINRSEINLKQNGYYSENKILAAVGFVHLKNGLCLVSFSNSNNTNSEIYGLEYYLISNMGIALIIIAVIAGLIIWFIVGIPLNKITLVANEIGKHNYDVKLSVSDMTDEVGTLARSINVMKENVKTAEEMLSNILNSVPQSIFWKDKKSVYLGCNSNFVKAAGLENRSQVIGKTDFQMPWKGEETDAFIKDDTEVINSGNPKYHIIEKLTDKDGNHLWVDTTKLPLYDADGNSYGVLGIYDDITERKQTEEALKKSEERYRSLYKNAPVGVLYSSITGKIISVNDEFARMLGYTSPEEVKDIVNQSTIAKTIYIHSDAMNNLLKQATIAHGSWIKTEQQFRKKDGTNIITNLIIRTLPENPDQLEGFVEDITERTQAEEALRESEMKFRTMFESSRDAINLSQNGLQVYANSAYLQLYGYDKVEEIIGIPIIVHIASSHREQVMKIAQRRAKGESVPDFYETRGRKKDGTEFAVEVKVSTYKLQGETFSFAIMRDITARKLAEEELKASEQRFKILTESTFEGVAVLYDRKFIDVNDQFLKMLRCPREFIIGKNTYDFIAPESMDYYLKVRDQFITSPIELIAIRPDGSKFPFETRFRSHIINEKEYRLLSIQDITERKNAENALKNALNEIEYLINALPVAIISVDRKLAVQKYNNQASTYKSDTDINDNNILLFDMFPQLDFVRNILELSISKAEFINEEITINDKNGGSRACNVSIIPINNSANSGSIIMIEDFTERKKIENLMIQSEKMLSVAGLAAGMAHEINNPLGTISQGCQNIIRRTSAQLQKNIDTAKALDIDISVIEEYFKQRQIYEIIDSMRNAANKAADIISNMLQFSRKSESKKINYSLQKLIDESLALAYNNYDTKNKYEFRNIEIIKEYEENLPEIRLTVIEIQQVFLNIFQNAAQALKKERIKKNKAKIIIRLYKEGKYITAEIEDNGPGMDENVKRRVFEPFFTTKEVGEGTGLGMSVSYMIIKNNHQGIISVESSEGIGTKFIIKLPL